MENMENTDRPQHSDGGDSDMENMENTDRPQHSDGGEDTFQSRTDSRAGRRCRAFSFRSRRGRRCTALGRRCRAFRSHSVV